MEDTLTGDLIEVAARRVIVAGGVWNDRIELLGNRGAAARLRPSKGIHLVFRREDVALAGAASFIPDAARRKMLFLIPWHDVVVVGTTDSDYEGDLDHPAVTAEERTYLLDALNAALGLSLSESNIVGARAGLRPLVRSKRNATVDLSRAHAVYDLAPGAETGLTWPLVEGRAPIGAEAVYCARSEMVVQLSDHLARRTRLSLTEAGAGVGEGALGLEILAEELSWSSHEAERQRSAYRSEVELERGLPLPQRALV